MSHRLSLCVCLLPWTWCWWHWNVCKSLAPSSSQITYSFSTLSLCVGWQEVHQACKNATSVIAKGSLEAFQGLGITWRVNRPIRQTRNVSQDHSSQISDTNMSLLSFLQSGRYPFTSQQCQSFEAASWNILDKLLCKREEMMNFWGVTLDPDHCIAMLQVALLLWTFEWLRERTEHFDIFLSVHQSVVFYFRCSVY